MSFIIKILDALKMDSIREMEKTEEMSISESNEGQSSNAYGTACRSRCG